jgi:hypothetical protein
VDVADGGASGWNRALCTASSASVVQASRFRSGVTVFRIRSGRGPKTGSEPTFRRNTAARVSTIEAGHNPEVAGSNPAPVLEKPRKTGAFLLSLRRAGPFPDLLQLVIHVASWLG